MMKKTNDPTMVKTGYRTRWNFLNVFEPKSIGDARERYSVSLLISKSDRATLEAIDAAIKAAYDEGVERYRYTLPYIPDFDELKHPLRDGDIDGPNNPWYKDTYFINASSVQKPLLLNRNNQPIEDRREIHAGVFGNACLKFYMYNRGETLGIFCQLCGLKKIQDGDRLNTDPDYRAVMDLLSDDDDECEYLL